MGRVKGLWGLIPYLNNGVKGKRCDCSLGELTHLTNCSILIVVW